jgi:hypothetical protein
LWSFDLFLSSHSFSLLCCAAFQRYQALPKGAVAGAAQKHYVGGFEPTMTKAEAALILGIRRSASIKKIKGLYLFCICFIVFFEFNSCSL